MSKTMDNDQPKYPYISERDAEIERLKADLQATRQRKDEYRTDNLILRARIEELEAHGKRQREHSASWFDEAHKLRALNEGLELDLIFNKAWQVKICEERDSLRAELEQIKGENMAKHPPDFDNTIPAMVIDNLKAENARLKAELAAAQSDRDLLDDTNRRLVYELTATKPVPVVTHKHMMFEAGRWSGVLDQPTAHTNLKLTFTDGILTGAEVVGK